MVLTNSKMSKQLIKDVKWRRAVPKYFKFQQPKLSAELEIAWC